MDLIHGVFIIIVFLLIFVCGYNPIELILIGIKLICGFYAICPCVVTLWLWVKGIRTARKLKSIDDVDTYNKKLKLSFLLIFLGVVGIGVSIFSILVITDVLKNI